METLMLKSLSFGAKLKHLLFLINFLLVAFTIQELKAQTPGIVIKGINPAHEDLLSAMNSMMGKIYSLKMSGDFDKDYAAILQEFDQGGSDLCKIYIMSGEDPKLIENAKVSVVELKAHQKQLRYFAAYDKLPDTQITHHNDLMGTINKMMSEMKRKATSGNINNDFATMMVLYNWAATEMAKSEIHYGLNPEIKGQAKETLEELSCVENGYMDWFSKTSVAKQ